MRLYSYTVSGIPDNQGQYRSRDWGPGTGDQGVVTREWGPGSGWPEIGNQGVGTSKCLAPYTGGGSMPPTDY